MKAIKYSTLCLLSVASLLATACSKDNAEYSVNKNRAYIAETATKGNTTGRVQVAIDEPEGRSAHISVRLSDRQNKDQRFRLRMMSAEELKSYNTENNVEYLQLPEAQYQLAKDVVTVKAGQVVSEEVAVKVLPLTEELQSSGNIYVLPFKLESLDGMQTVIGGDEYIYKVKPTEITTAPVIGVDYGKEGNTRGIPFPGNLRMLRAKGGQRAELTKWTFECRINMSGFTINNQMIFSHNGGAGSEIYIRFGDAPIPYNKLNIKVGGAQIDQSETSFEPNTWYHIAVVYDGTNVTLYVNGKKDTSIDKIAGKVFTLGDAISLANYYPYSREYFINRAMISEVRVWNVARTADELSEYEYSVSPKSKGLLHYWRLNEGKGREMRNSVEGAPSMFAVTYNTGTKQETDAPIRWMDNVRSDEKTRKTIAGGSAPSK